MNDEKQAIQELAEAGRYLRLTDANDRGLVILSMGLGYWLFREGDFFVICVESRHLQSAALELEKFELENSRRALEPSPDFVKEKPSSIPLFIFAWMMGLFYLVQQNAAESWTEAGAASSGAIMERGEWWRTITALTLHADPGHLAANLAAGLLFAAFLQPILGTGLTWMAILLSGALGNGLNAWGYRGESHLSIGASTAVFSALGILVACQTCALAGAGRRVRLWEIILPTGAGISLFAWLGHGGEHVDVMAHFWGFATGCTTGTLLTVFKVKKYLSPLTQKVLAGTALVLPPLAWLGVIRNGL